MRREHRPGYLVQATRTLRDAYARHFVHPHFDRVGEGCRFDGPRHVHVFGGQVTLGRHAHVIATAPRPVELSVWSVGGIPGSIQIGDYAMINPGLRISAARRVEIGDNALFAPNVFITDADWHDVYDRVSLGRVAEVVLEDNVWVGESAMIFKGVRIGKNSVVGGGAVVTRDVPQNAVVVGNPAKVVTELDPTRRFASRSDLLRDPDTFTAEARAAERVLLRDNSIYGYLRYLLRPRRTD